MAKVDPGTLGLPSRDELAAMRIWDLHFHALENMEEVLPYLDRMAIERLFSLDIGGWGEDAEQRKEDARDRELLEKWHERVFGIIRIDPTRPEASVEKMQQWLVNGPAVGIKYQGRYSEDITCAHPNNDPIIELAARHDAVIYIHTWIRVGGNPRRVGGGTFTGASEPSDVAELAGRFPEVPLICGHAGGDWEIGTRAVRPHENVYFEFSGGDPWSTAVDLAVNELGEDRIVWGGHLASRSYSTELGKVYDADLTDEQRYKILGANLRTISSSVLREKGYTFEE